MTSEMTGVLIAVGAVSAACLVLMTRVENKRVNRARSRGGSAYDRSISSDSGSWSFVSWVGHSSSNDASGHAADSGACTSGSWDGGNSDSGSGGDCGGGGGSGGSD